MLMMVSRNTVVPTRPLPPSGRTTTRTTAHLRKSPLRHSSPLSLRRRRKKLLLPPRTRWRSTTPRTKRRSARDTKVKPLKSGLSARRRRRRRRKRRSGESPSRTTAMTATKLVSSSREVVRLSLPDSVAAFYMALQAFKACVCSSVRACYLGAFPVPYYHHYYLVLFSLFLFLFFCLSFSLSIGVLGRKGVMLDFPGFIVLKS